MKVTISGTEYTIIHNSGYNETDYNRRHAICADDNGNLYAIGAVGTGTSRGAHILKSINNGSSWTYLSALGYDAYLASATMAHNKHNGNIYFAFFYIHTSARMVRGYFTPSGTVTATVWVSTANSNTTSNSVWTYAKTTSITIDNDGYIHLCFTTGENTNYQRYTKVHYSNYFTDRNSGNWYNISGNTNIANDNYPTFFSGTSNGVMYPMTNGITVIYCYKNSNIYKIVLNTKTNPITVISSDRLYSSGELYPTEVSLSVAESDNSNSTYFIVKGYGSITGGTSNTFTDLVMIKETYSNSNSITSSPMFIKDVYGSYVSSTSYFYHNALYKKNRLYVNIVTRQAGLDDFDMAVISISSNGTYKLEIPSKSIINAKCRYAFLLISNKNKIFTFDYYGYFGVISLSYSNIKRWTGTTYAYDIGSVKRWSGTAYQTVKLKRWDGAKYIYLN